MRFADFINHPISQYRAPNQVVPEVYGYGIVMPHELPPSNMVFPYPQYNRMLNIPSVQSVYTAGRNGARF